jgi:hypothetical protein
MVWPHPATYRLNDGLVTRGVPKVSSAQSLKRRRRRRTALWGRPVREKSEIGVLSDVPIIPNLAIDLVGVGIAHQGVEVPPAFRSAVEELGLHTKQIAHPRTLSW